ncbi:hypothetical protein, partial [Ilumatobacter sp.]|uniref:hypothetical protein n=1 Tax=Ilumatobacter sp. TaxID=1967498 RepID=UPI003C5BCD5D
MTGSDFDEFDDDELWPDSRIDIVAEPLRYSRAPLVALLVIAILPAIGLLALNRWADSRADEYEATRSASFLDADLDGAIAIGTDVPAADAD